MPASARSFSNHFMAIGLPENPVGFGKRRVEHVGVEFRDIGIAEQKDIVVLDIEATEREIGRAGRDRERHRGVAATCGAR